MIIVVVIIIIVVVVVVVVVVIIIIIIIIIITIIITIIIIIIRTRMRIGIMTLNGTVPFFLNLPQCPELSPTSTLKWPGRSRVPMTCHTPGADHVQQAVCRLIRRDSSAIKFGKAEKSSLLFLKFCWQKP